MIRAFNKGKKAITIRSSPCSGEKKNETADADYGGGEREREFILLWGGKKKEWASPEQGVGGGISVLIPAKEKKKVGSREQLLLSCGGGKPTKHTYIEEGEKPGSVCALTGPEMIVPPPEKKKKENTICTSGGKGCRLNRLLTRQHCN